MTCNSNELSPAIYFHLSGNCLYFRSSLTSAIVSPIGCTVLRKRRGYCIQSHIAPELGLTVHLGLRLLGEEPVLGARTTARLDK
jgi:hypothetical protein